MSSMRTRIKCYFQSLWLETRACIYSYTRVFLSYCDDSLIYSNVGGEKKFIIN